jgi:hypothetical protein
VVADGVVLSDHIVTGGIVSLSEPATAIEIGLPYTHVIEPLPPPTFGDGVMIRKLRLIEAVFRVKETKALRVDVGQGLRDISMRQLGEDEILDAPPPSVSGDIRVRAIGWKKQYSDTLWRIEQSAPLPFTLLSVVTEAKIND